MKYVLVMILFIVSIVFAFPKPVGFVNDFANILPYKNLLEQSLSEYEKNTTIEIAVVTIESLPEDQTAATYAVELFQEWGIGKKGEDNGIFVLIVKNGTLGNRMRIEIGYGVQGYITGAEAGRILDRALSFYTQDDYQAAAEIIVQGLREELKSYTPGRGERNELDNTLTITVSNMPLIIFFAFILIFLISVILSNRCPYCIKGKLERQEDHYVCKRCGKKVTKAKRYAPVLIGGGRGFSRGGGFGGFGGGSSGGGGAGR